MTGGGTYYGFTAYGAYYGYWGTGGPAFATAYDAYPGYGYDYWLYTWYY